MGRAVTEMEKSCALMTEEAEENLQCFRELATLYSKAGRDQELSVLEAEISRLGLSSAETRWVAAAVMAKWRSTVTSKTDSTLAAPKADSWASDGSSVTMAARAAPANKQSSQQRQGVDRLPPSGFSRQEKHQATTKAERAFAEVEPVRRKLNEIVLAFAHEQADAMSQLRTLVQHLEVASEQKQFVGSSADSAAAASADEKSAAVTSTHSNSQDAHTVVSDSLDEHGVYTRAIVAQLLLEARRYLAVMEGVESGGWRNLETLPPPSSSSSSSSSVDATLAIPGFQSWSDVVQVFRYCRLHAQTRLETDAAAQKTSTEGSKRTSASRRPRRSSSSSSSSSPSGSASAGKKDASKEKKDAASKDGSVGRGSALGLWAVVALVVTALLNSRNGNKKRSRLPSLAEVYAWCLSVASCWYASWKEGTWRHDSKSKVARAYATTCALVLVWLYRLSGGRFGALPIDELVAEEVQLQEKAAHKVKKEKERQEEAKRMKAASNKRGRKESASSSSSSSSSQHNRSETSKSLRHRNSTSSSTSAGAASEALVDSHSSSSSSKKSGFGEDFGDWVEDDDDGTTGIQQRAESVDQWIEAPGPNNRRKKGQGGNAAAAAAVHVPSKPSLPAKPAAAYSAPKPGAPQSSKPAAPPPSISTKAAAAQATKPSSSAPVSRSIAAAPAKKKEMSSSSWPSSSLSSSAEPLAPSVASLFASSSSSNAPDSPSCIAVGLSSPRTSSSFSSSGGEKLDGSQYTSDGGTTVRPAFRDLSSMSDRSRSRSQGASSTSSRQSSSEGEDNTTTSSNSSKDERVMMSPEYMQQQMQLQQMQLMMAPPELWAQHQAQQQQQMMPMMPLDPSAPYATAEENEITAALRWQMEFYFSAQNLCRDMYLRGQMDPLGFVSLATCAQFNKMQQLLVAAGPRGPEFLFAALQTSKTLHVAVPWAMRASPGPHPYAAIFVSGGG